MVLILKFEGAEGHKQIYLWKCLLLLAIKAIYVKVIERSVLKLQYGVNQRFLFGGSLFFENHFFPNEKEYRRMVNIFFYYNKRNSD